MANDSQRNKARATFGKTFFENSKALPQPKNAAVALQKRANARPIPTYKVGGVVKKQNGGRSPEADDVLMSTPRGQRMLEEQKRREREAAAAKAKAEAEKRAAADKLLGITAKKEGGYSEGGRMKGSTDSARMRGSTDAARIPVTLDEKRKKIRLNEKRVPVTLNEKRVPVTLNEKRVRVPSIEYKDGGRADKDFTGLMKQAASRAAAKGNPVMKQGGATNDYIAKRVNARMQAGNYKDGGAVKDRMEARMRDVEKDYKIALAKGKNENIAKAKFERRKADVADDYAKKTGADRTATKAAEQAAKATLKEARRTKGASIAKRDFDAGMMEKSAGELKQFSAGKTKMPDVSETLKGVGGLGAMPSAAPKAAATKTRVTPVRKASVTGQARSTSGQGLAAANRPTGSVVAAPAAPTPKSGANTPAVNPRLVTPTSSNLLTDQAAIKKAKQQADAKKEMAEAKNKRLSALGDFLRNIPKPAIFGSGDADKSYAERQRRMGYTTPVKRAAGGAGKVRKGQMKGC